MLEPWLRFFPCFFLSCKANARVKLVKTGHGPHSSTLVVICVVRLLFVLFYLLFVCKYVLPPSDNPTAGNKYITTVQCVSNKQSKFAPWKGTNFLSLCRYRSFQNSNLIEFLLKNEWDLTLRLLMSYIYIYIYIYGAPILDVSRSHTTTHHSR